MSSPTCTVELAGAYVEDDTLEGVSVTYGRQRVLDTVSPTSCTIEVLTGYTATPQLGDSVSVKSNVSGTDYARFQGFVTSVSIGRYTTSVTCSSLGLGRMATIPAADYLVSAGTGAGPNINQALLDAGFIGEGIFTTGFTYDTGDTTIIPGYVVPAGNLLAQAQQLAAYDTLGVLWEDQSGSVYFSDANSRTLTSGTFIPTSSPGIYGPCPILDQWTTSASLDGLINAASVTYGRPSRTITIVDGGSVDTWGPFRWDEELPVLDDDDAARRASRLVAGFSQPTFQTQPLVLELGLASTTLQAQLLQLEVGSYVSWLPGTPAAIPGIPSDCFLEGYTERISQNTHRLDLYLSDARLTQALQTWSAVTPTLTWAAAPAGLTWYNAALTTL